ncbi:hypothetical protein FOA52_015846 [Chlamydomonas sp. UWO 241]|nr:hypothetical protein FOA52_015846 [Chlamydomonas sp. UWO 241]
MYKEPIFMSVVPNRFFDANGSVPFTQIVLVVTILFSFTFLFDLIFIFLNYYTWQCLPLVNTWRRIKNAQGWYALFLVYAFMTMGVMFLFHTMLLLPRATFCKTNNNCDCATMGYSVICEGGYISLISDYLVDT